MIPEAEGLNALVALGDSQRRRVFGIVRSMGQPVTRDQVASAAGISRKLAAFHLDKLVAAGLLRARYGTPDGVRRVGRAPKLYEPSGVDVRVAIPQRRHDLLAEILVDAVGQIDSATSAALESARARGTAVGAAEREILRPGRLGAERGLTLTAGVVERYGFEPVRGDQGRVRLRNCPFHPLAARNRDLVCAVNHAFLDGVLHGLGADGVAAVLAPAAGHCCVEFRVKAAF